MQDGPEELRATVPFGLYGCCFNNIEDCVIAAITLEFFFYTSVLIAVKTITECDDSRNELVRNGAGKMYCWTAITTLLGIK